MGSMLGQYRRTYTGASRETIRFVNTVSWRLNGYVWWYNTGCREGFNGALKGNNTMLDNYGMAVNDTLVKQRAFELGLISQGEELSLVAKQAATLSLIYEQSGAAQGQASMRAVK